MPHIEPTREAFAALAALPQNEGPIAMINLLRYRERAAYPTGSLHAPCSGFEAYLRYGAAVQAFLDKVGGQVVWHGQPKLTLIGPAEERWDDVFIARYPDPAAFLRMVTDPEYLAIAVHRSAALEDSRLILTRPGA